MKCIPGMSFRSLLAEAEYLSLHLPYKALDSSLPRFDLFTL